MGVNFGTLLGDLLGSWLNVIFDWRTVFFVVGLPGILPDLIVHFTPVGPVRELTES
ncbi:hypothetical protein [Pseudohalioglobus lutimaris]|jgi:MFS family permease|uniref:hypothetical protein n=1 Tax=Pseudohalioglobus lutimaris TaxID=1737061 RepID=UPI001FAEFEED|nr:hypothetical protein [Pseudohalioglobus lutimaris]